MTQQKKLRLLSCISLYPLFSTFLMTLIWQIARQYCTPFLGGYYFKWVFLYSENNSEWLSESYLTVTRWLYFVYIGAYVTLVILTLLVLFRRNGKAICTWILCGLWVGDLVWIVLDMVNSGIQWQFFFLMGEHLIFLVCSVVFSVYYLQTKRKFPELFKLKKRNRHFYRKRF